MNTDFNIQTTRLHWHKLSDIYLEDIFRELTDTVTKYLRVPTPTHIQQEADWIISTQKAYEEGKQINFVLTDDQGIFIGIGSILDLDTNTPELGLWIKESARGKGYGKEIIQGLLSWLEEHKTPDYVIYRAHVDNLATRKIAEAFGGELVRNPDGSVFEFSEKKFDNSATFQAVEYRIYKK